MGYMALLATLCHGENLSWSCSSTTTRFNYCSAEPVTNFRTKRIGGGAGDLNDKSKKQMRKELNGDLQLITEFADKNDRQHSFAHGGLYTQSWRKSHFTKENKEMFLINTFIKMTPFSLNQDDTVYDFEN